ncbi:ABC transporter ATP-binding protein [Temperatibacter marinus]|uniref:ABC transporter ATP-binding protein n=1 Tax=Temperatibacter marinus TaxID=1456591 RepID=A0AA52HBP9_9PROT|nr:ABC transporter ATP-binding protein [Temperatibacter marinus]WND03980.1 ABC transporter ATP-binding protein [Temperatibacter marinus]
MITVQNLSVSVNNTVLLKNISLEIPAGKLIALVGPNGAGKTSLMKTLIGLHDFEGTIKINSVPLDAVDPEHRAKKIAYMPQGTTIHWPMTVENIVALGRYPHGMTEQKDKSIITDALETVGITALKDRIVTTLSGGERALTLLARTLATKADCLLIDEPTASLDPRHQLDVMAVFRRLTDQGKTIIVILHDLHLAQRFADRLILLDQGRLISSGPASKALSAHNLKQVYGLIEGTDGFEAVDS